MGEPERALAGLRGYVQAVRLFSRNARLYMLHIVGMDMIHGTWDVLFNLYLLALGFDIRFIGLRLVIGRAAQALAAVPAGLVSDRIGRKWSFVLGDGGGAAIALVNISTANPAVLLATPAIGAFFGSLHATSEPAFMAENSEPRERVHLFSVGGSLSYLAVAAGSVVAAVFARRYLPVLGDVATYRAATWAGIALWFLSLVPAWLLRERVRPPLAAGAAQADAGRTIGLFGRRIGWVRHPDRIIRLVFAGGLLSLGAGFVLDYLNVFFHRHLHAAVHEIGLTFGAGDVILAATMILAPFLVQRLTKIQAVVATRLLSVPFILVLGFAADLPGQFAPALTLAGLGYALRMVLMNIGQPVYSAFTMEILDPGERGFATGLLIAVGGALAAAGNYAGAAMMDAGDFRTPFVLMACLYALSTAAVWAFFRPLEREEAALVPALAGGSE